MEIRCMRRWEKYNFGMGISAAPVLNSGDMMTWRLCTVLTWTWKQSCFVGSFRGATNLVSFHHRPDMEMKNKLFLCGTICIDIIINPAPDLKYSSWNNWHPLSASKGSVIMAILPWVGKKENTWTMMDAGRKHLKLKQNVFVRWVVAGVQHRSQAKVRLAAAAFHIVVKFHRRF